MVGSRLRQFIQSKKSDEEIEEEMKYILGDGPMRFGNPVRRMKNRTLQEESKGLSNQHVMKFVNLKVKWDMDTPSKEAKNRYSDVEMLRFFVFCKFDVNRTFKLMCKTNPRYFSLTANDTDLCQQLMSKTLFPVPGLKSISGADVFYMKPSRYNPNETKTSLVIDNLIYVMNTISMKQGIVPNPASSSSKTATKGGAADGETGGIAFIANMNDWTMNHFSVDYCRKFMQTLQGQRFPIKVNLFLIVNPPKWFDKIWSIMKPMLSSKFRQKVHMITEDELWTFLAPDYEEYLPDEFRDGQANTTELVNDFILYQQQLEDYDRVTPMFGFGNKGKKKVINRPGGGGFSFVSNNGSKGKQTNMKASQGNANKQPSSFLSLPYSNKQQQQVLEDTERTASISLRGFR